MMNVSHEESSEWLNLPVGFENIFWSFHEEKLG